MDDLPTGSGFSPIASNASNLPYPVRPKGWSFYLALIGSGGLAVFAIALAVIMLPTYRHDGNVTSLLLLALFVAFAGYRLWLLYSPDVILYPDRIEKRNLLGEWRALSRDQVRGVGKTTYSRSGSYFEIIPKSATDPSIRLPASARTDPTVAAWLQGARDPEAEIRAADRAAILSNDRFGATETERSENLQTAKRFATAFSVICFAVAVWIYISEKPYWLSIGAALVAPLVGWLLVRSANGLVLWFGKTVARPQIGLAAAAPAMALGASAMLHNHLYDPWTPGMVGAGVGLIVGILIFAAGQTDLSIRNLAVLAGLAAGLGAFGLVSTADVALDQGAAKVFMARVLDKHASHGRSTSYYLDLNGWPGHGAGDVGVDGNLYDDVPVGAAVCISHHGGAFRLPWFVVAACPGGASSSPPGVGAFGLPNESQYYPERAQRMQIEGSAAVECAVTDILTLENCRVLSESPAGYGFGTAAVARLQNGFSVKTPPHGDVHTFRTIVRFKLAS